MIVTADDFGLDEPTNAAIVQAFGAALISRASVMPNMPGFDEACELAHESQLLDRIGAHIVLTQGVPLTERIRRCGRFCDDDGRFLRWRGRTPALLSRSQREAIARECDAQIRRCIESGLVLSHADSHHHVHVEPALAPIFVSLVRASGIRHLRLARNCGPGRSPARRTYQAVFNASLRRLGLAACRFFGGVDDYLYLRDRGVPTDAARDMEVETHPRLATGVPGGLVDVDSPERPFSAYVDPLRPFS